MSVVLALDIATTTGWALGPAGQAPSYGKVLLKKPDEHPRESAFNLMCFLADMFRIDPPDLVAWEEPMPPTFHVRKAAETGRVMQNNSSMTLPLYLDGVLWACCKRKGIRGIPVNRMKVLKHFTGKGRWGGRAEAKRAVIQRCHALKLMPEKIKSDDIADAISIHSWASANFFNKFTNNLVLFDQGRMKHGGV